RRKPFDAACRSRLAGATECPQIAAHSGRCVMSGLTRREVLKAAGIAGAAVALPSARPGSAAAQGTQKRELVVAQGGDISKFDPHFSTSSNDIRVSFNLFYNVVSRHPDGKLYPSLTTEWNLTNTRTS